MKKLTAIVRIGLVGEIIRMIEHTDHHGDGIVYVSPVDRAAKIRSDEEGESVLQP